MLVRSSAKQTNIPTNTILMIKKRMKQTGQLAGQRTKSKGVAFYPICSGKKSILAILVLNCFDTVFQRPYRHFSIVLKVFFTLSDRYKIFTSNWRWIEFVKMQF